MELVIALLICYDVFTSEDIPFSVIMYLVSWLDLISGRFHWDAFLQKSKIIAIDAFSSRKEIFYANKIAAVFSYYPLT